MVQLTNSTGAKVKDYTYDAFGNEQNIDVTDTNVFWYCGGDFDKEMGTIYLRARYYNPGTGRFITEDTYWNTSNMIYGDDGFPSITAIMQSSNLYLYALNNPILWIDPSGYVIRLSSSAVDFLKEEYERANAYLKTSEDGKALIEKLDESEEIFTIQIFSEMNGHYSPDTRTIYWNHKLGVIMKDGSFFMRDKNSVMSPAMVLAHEMGHAAQHLDGEMKAGKYYNKKQVDAIEEVNLAKNETRIAKQFGEPTRKSYNSHRGGTIMNNSTHYKTVYRGYSWWKYYTEDHGLFWSGTTITAGPVK